MGLFASSRKKKLYDIVNGMGTDIIRTGPGDPRGDFIPPDPQEVAQEYDPRGEASPPPQGGGFMGKGGVGRGIAGTIGDFLLQRAHMAPVYAPAMQHQQDMEDRQQQFMREQQGSLDTWKKQQEYKRENPDPMSNDTERDYQLIRERLGDDAAQSYLRNKADPQQYMQVKDPSSGEIRIIPVPKGGGGQAAAGPVPGTVKGNYRFKGGNPNDQNAWEEIGGAGPAAAPGGFLRPRR
jgi:hypothetical protein